MNGKWDELLDRRQICKERYRNIKKELEDATDALTQIGKKKEDKLPNPAPVIKLDAFSFIPSNSRNEINKSSRNIERNSKFVNSISSKIGDDNRSRSSRFSDCSSIGSDLSSRSSREVSSGFAERSSRVREQSSDPKQFGSRFTEHCSRVREPSSDRLKFGSRFMEQRSFRDQSSNQSGSRFTEQRSSSRVRGRSSNVNELEETISRLKGN